MKWLLFLPVVAGVALAARAQFSPSSPKSLSVPPVRLVGVPTGQTNALGLTVPAGFRVSVFAEGLDRPRRLAVVPKKGGKGYDVAVSLSYDGEVVLLRDSNGSGVADSRTTLLSGLNQPYGLAFDGTSLYVGNTDAVWRYPFTPGQTKVTGGGRKIADLTRGGYNNHWTRNLLFDASKRSLFVTVGSSCNVCEEGDHQRAALSVMRPDGSGKHVVASGLRNPTGLAWNPANKSLWTVVNERDQLGDDLPPDFLTSLAPGRFYGWPYAYTDPARRVVPDPIFGAAHPDRVRATTPPDFPVQAHSAALGVAFYPLSDAGGNFPAQYRGDAFLSFHGSWNRAHKTGYKVVRVHFAHGKPVEVSDFVTGFLKGESNWGRPVDIQLAPDGSLLFSDDQGGKIWRVSYVGDGSGRAS